MSSASRSRSMPIRRSVEAHRMAFRLAMITAGRAASPFGAPDSAISKMIAQRRTKVPMG